MSSEHVTRGELAAGLGELTRLGRDSLARMSSNQSLRGELAVVERFAAKCGKAQQALGLARTGSRGRAR